MSNEINITVTPAELLLIGNMLRYDINIPQMMVNDDDMITSGIQSGLETSNSSTSITHAMNDLQERLEEAITQARKSCEEEKTHEKEKIHAKKIEAQKNTISSGVVRVHYIDISDEDYDQMDADGYKADDDHQYIEMECTSANAEVIMKYSGYDDEVAVHLMESVDFIFFSKD